VARTYAGILGPLAFLTSLAHGLIHARSNEAALFGAWCSLLLFAAAGYVLGWIAGRTIEQSVQATIEAELAREESSGPPAEAAA
jgi:H+/gluconate symporter-like permease